MKRMERAKWVKSMAGGVLATVMLVGCLAGCGSSGTNSEQASDPSQRVAKDTLVIAKAEDVTSLDPQAIVNEKSFSIYCNMYEGLVTYDAETQTVNPCLATEWEQIDDLTYHFTLREGVKFHDGNTMTSADVVASFDRMVNSGVVSTYVSFIDYVEADGDYAITMHIKEPYAQIMQALSNPSAVVVSKAAVEKYGDDFANHPVGTGPYKFVEWKVADSISLTAFEDYWGEPAKTKNLVFKVIPEGAQRTIMLETGEVDIAASILPVDAPRVEEDPSLSLFHETGYKVTMLFLKCDSNGPTSNPLVRQAIECGINKQEIVDAVVNGYGEAGSLYCTPKTSGYTSEKDRGNAYDPEKAKELLAQAGYPDGCKIEAYVASNQTYEEIAAIIQAQLAEVGIVLDITVMESNAINEKVYSGEDIPLRINFYNNLCGDLDLVLQKLVPSAYGQVYFNDQVTELMYEARSKTDLQQRQEVYNRFWDLMAEDKPWIALYYEETLIGMSNKVEGFQF